MFWKPVREISFGWESPARQKHELVFHQMSLTQYHIFIYLQILCKSCLLIMIMTSHHIFWDGLPKGSLLLYLFLYLYFLSEFAHVFVHLYLSQCNPHNNKKTKGNPNNVSNQQTCTEELVAWMWKLFAEKVMAKLCFRRRLKSWTIFSHNTAMC